MKPVIVVLLLVTTVAHAQYKCVDAEGKTTFQQAACPNTQKQQVLKVNAAPPSPVAPPSTGGAAPVPGQTADERIWATMKRDKRIEELERAIADTEADINNRSVLMSNEMAALSSRKSRANNNLAGATWEQSLSTEMQAVAAKYKAMNDVDIERLKVLRADLDATRKPSAK